jgi:hypothetical protein
MKVEPFTDDYHGQIHELKTWPAHYTLVRDGRKPFELRLDDRKYAVDDLLILREWDPDARIYSGRVTCAVVTCVVKGEWLREGYVALGLRVLR